MRLRVEVTAEDIEDGVSGNAWSCPIAFATRRALRACGKLEEAGVFAVDDRYVLEVGGGLTPDIPLPEEASAFVARFDGGGRDVNPIAFEVDLP